MVNKFCWYCGKLAFETWHTTWDIEGQEWPMCESCSIAVRRRLILRADGLTYEADLGDDEHGIDTRNIAGKWIDPQDNKKTITFSTLQSRPLAALVMSAARGFKK